MGGVDPMYQFSLDAYIDLFVLSIEKSQKSNKLEERIPNLNDYHTYAVYRLINYVQLIFMLTFSSVHIVQLLFFFFTSILSVNLF